MGRWLDLASSLETNKGGGDNRDDRDKMEGQGANVPNVPNVPAPSPRDLFLAWDKDIASLDPDRPLGGIALARWQRIVRDCDRLIADFGQSAAALGWSTIDLFGLDPDGGNIGGLAWRLDGGRVIAMDENAATYRWPYSDRTSRFAQGYLEQLPASFVPVWELPE